MLLPLKDQNPLRRVRFQYVTVAAIAACVAVFLWQLGLDPREARRALLAYGVVPAVLFDYKDLPAAIAVVPAPLTLVTSMFLHGGWMHLLGNMLFLWVLGDNVEDATGHARFVVFYLLAGIAAGLAQSAVAPQSTVPMIGASGAISGVLGAYFILFPHASVLTLVIFGFFWRVVRIPAILVLGFWMVVQILNGLGSFGAGGGVAWFAHIGGFFAGMGLLLLLRPRPARRPWS